MKIEMTGTDEWEFAITGLDRRTLLLIATVVRQHLRDGELHAPEDRDLLSAAREMMVDALYPLDAVVAFKGETGEQS